jgi:tetrahydromethanopterin S-methyltransferase subunit C
MVLILTIPPLRKQLGSGYPSVGRLCCKGTASSASCSIAEAVLQLPFMAYAVFSNVISYFLLTFLSSLSHKSLTLELSQK